MDSLLPLHPGAAAPADAGRELRARRARMVERLGEPAWEARRRALHVEAAAACLALTGAAPGPDERAAAEAAWKDGGAPPPAFAPVLGALEHVSRAARGGEGIGADLVASAHALCIGEPPPSMIRTIQIEPQFPGGGLSPPQTIGLRLGELFEWIGAPSGQELVPAPRAALFFARFLEISPFLRANFRVAHILLTWFSAAGGYPPIWFDRADAAGIRQDVSRAFRFDTAPLTARVEAAIRRSLDRVESVGPPL